MPAATAKRVYRIAGALPAPWEDFVPLEYGENHDYKAEPCFTIMTLDHKLEDEPDATAGTIATAGWGFDINVDAPAVTRDVAKRMIARALGCELDDIEIVEEHVSQSI